MKVILKSNALNLHAARLPRNVSVKTIQQLQWRNSIKKMVEENKEFLVDTDRLMTDSVMVFDSLGRPVHIPDYMIAQVIGDLRYSTYSCTWCGTQSKTKHISCCARPNVRVIKDISIYSDLTNNIMTL